MLRLLSLFVGVAAIPTLGSSSDSTALFSVHNITRSVELKFENLVVRCNGQVLVTTTQPNASVYQIDPLGILPMTLIHEFPNITSATGITEGARDIFYVASGDVNLKAPMSTTPQSYTISQIDMRGVSVLPDGTFNRRARVKHVANLPGAALLNGIAFARPHSNHLLVADSFRGLIWNVNVHTGVVGVTLNDTTTKGPTATGPTFTGINGIKIYNGSMYWTNTGDSAMYKVPITKEGKVAGGAKPILVISQLTCDDFAIDSEGNAYVAGPLDVITRVNASGEKAIIAGTFNSTHSSLVGPTAVQFGKAASDHRKMYITTNGGLSPSVPGTAGLSWIDLSLA